MADLPGREELIRQGKRLRAASSFVPKLQRWLRMGARCKGEELYLDTSVGRMRALWYPVEGAGPAPLYIDLHGGGFLLGSPEMDEKMNLALRESAGCAIVSLDYPKGPDAPYPAAVNGVHAAAAFLHRNADRFRIDRQRMAIGGYSAGGNLATVACMLAAKDGPHRFACQILAYPPLDLASDPDVKPQPTGAIPPSMARIFNACYVDPARAREPSASPVFAPLADLRSQPPALVLLAGRDSLRDEGLRYGRMLESAGVAVELHEYPDAAHGFSLGRSADAVDALGKMTDFLRRRHVAA